MDETKVEQTPQGTHTTINRTTDTPSSGGNGTMWFLLGGVVVVIAIIAYFVLGNGTVPSVDTAVQPSGGNVSINVDTNDAPAPAAEAPAAEAPAAPAEE